MFKKENRLKKEKDLDEVFKSGIFVSGDLFNLRYKSNNLGYNRYTAVVSKKISTKAVQRNLLKRKIRESIKGKEEIFKKGLDIVIMAKPTAKEKSFEQVNLSLEKLFSKAKLIKHDN